jgi:HK97 gp10 family phage protein
MPNPYINIDFTQVNTALREWIIGIQRGLEEGPQFAAEIGRQTATERVPVRTGFLRSTIHIERGEGFTVTIVADAPYAGFVELGTSTMRARPYMQPAFNEVVRILPSAIKERAGV